MQQCVHIHIDTEETPVQQYRRMDWVEEFADVGIEGVHRLDLVVPSKEVEMVLLRMLPGIKAQAARSTLSDQEESDLVPAVTLFNTPSILNKHKADFHIYIYGSMPRILQASSRKISGD